MGEMREKTDVELLREYAESGHEAAFRELVTRYADLVYSAALRQLETADLAGDITQGVFLDLARKAQPVSEQLAAHHSLAGWLHRSTRYAVLNHLRDTRRRVTNERLAMEQLLNNSEASVDWEQIRPALDEALDSLGDEDREALLLRYFKNHDLRTVGATLGVSDDAAQKRVSRAVERLREYFAKRGVTIGASGLVAVVSVNAVQAAPAGLALTISTAAALGGTTIATAATATKAIAMTTLQKTIIGATLAVAVGTGIYEARQASRLHDKVQAMQQQQAPLTAQILQLQRERDDATNSLALLGEEIERLKRNSLELLRLRGDNARLRSDLAELERQKSAMAVAPNLTHDPDWKLFIGASKPVNLSQYPDSTNIITRNLATNAGTATPVALLQTWLWALRVGDAEGLLKTVEFPESTSEAEKLEWVRGHQERPGYENDRFQHFLLRDLLSLGGNRYLALIGEWRSTPADMWVSRKILYEFGGEWKIQ